MLRAHRPPSRTACASVPASPRGTGPGSPSSSPRSTAHLAAYPVDSTELEVLVKDRGARGQKVTLECWIAGQQKIVTTSAEEDLHTAVNDVRDDLRRRLNDAKTRQEPRNNRHLRESTITDVISPELTPPLDDHRARRHRGVFRRRGAARSLTRFIALTRRTRARPRGYEPRASGRRRSPRPVRLLRGPVFPGAVCAPCVRKSLPGSARLRAANRSERRSLHRSVRRCRCSAQLRPFVAESDQLSEGHRRPALPMSPPPDVGGGDRRSPGRRREHLPFRGASLPAYFRVRVATRCRRAPRPDDRSGG